MGRKLKRDLEMKALPGILFDHQWIAFVDKNGRGHAQPDFYLVTDEMILLMEVKLTETPDWERQLVRLYKPLLSQIYNLPIATLGICKNIKTSLAGRKVDHPAELFQYPRPGIFVWHYLG